MRDYPFSSDELFSFSNSSPYLELDSKISHLKSSLEELKRDLNFPAVEDAVGNFIAQMSSILKPKYVFEMGSYYGHSAFWFLLGASESITQITLTEKRDDLLTHYQKLAWPNSWKEKMRYHNEDAFTVLKDEEEIDLALIDGVKGDYLKFLQELEKKCRSGSVVLIDNAYWRGSFLNPQIREEKSSARKIFELHQHLKESREWHANFVPFKDGLVMAIKA